MSRGILAALPLMLAFFGCSAIIIHELPENWYEAENERYAYRLTIPDSWHRSLNSRIRPTIFKCAPAEGDAAIIVYVDEGGRTPEIPEFEESLENSEGKESLALLRNWRSSFSNRVGYYVTFLWKGTISIGEEITIGKPGTEYRAIVAVIDRAPSPVYLICYAENKIFKDLYLKYFADVQQSIKVGHAEITVRGIPAPSK